MMAEAVEVAKASKRMFVFGAMCLLLLVMHIADVRV
jgi:hypothetical protein